MLEPTTLRGTSTSIKVPYLQHSSLFNTSSLFQSTHFVLISSYTSPTLIRNNRGSDTRPLKCMPPPRKCIWSRYDLDLWPLTLKTSSAMMKICTKFHWNRSTKYRDTARHVKYACWLADDAHGRPYVDEYPSAETVHLISLWPWPLMSDF